MRAAAHMERLLFGGFLALALLLGGGAEVAGQTPGRPEITELHFEGNRTFPDRQLRNAILTRQTECRSFLYKWVVPFCLLGSEFAQDPWYYNPRIFRNDYWRIHTFYRSKGFRQIQLDTAMVRPTPTTLEVTFLIEEGDPVRISTLDFAGLGDVPGVTENLPAGVGDRLDMPMLQAAADTVVRRLQNQGYAQAEIFRDVFIPAGTLEGEVLFDVFTGPEARFGPITIEGNEGVSEEVIRRMLPFREGDLYARERLFDAQRNLFSLEIFRHAAIEPDFEHEPDSIIPLEVQVAEGNARRVRAGGGWNNADCFSTEARWSSRNFMGGARRLVLRGRVSNLLTSTLEESICRGAGTGDYARLNGLVAAEFTQPWIFSPRNTLDAAIFAERQSVPDVYIRESLGLNLALTRIIGRSSPLTLTYQPQLGRLEAAEVFFCTNFLVCSTDEISILAAANVLAPLGLRFSRDRTNRAVAPTGGWTVAAEVEHASAVTFSDFDYDRVVSEVTGFQGLPGGLVLAARLRGGWLGASEFRGFQGTAREVTRVAPPQKRFYAGGANSVRGYAQNQLGPRVVTVGVEELLFAEEEGATGICSPESVADLSCNASSLAEGDFASRPSGGSAVVEGSLELRFPVFAPYLAGGLFVDFGQVWSDPDDAGLGDLVWTPGVGLRYSTPIGPVRLDVAYRPAARQELPVVTSAIRPWVEGEDPEGARIVNPSTGDPIDWVFVDALARLEPPVSFTETAGFSWRRVQLQFSIGHAF
jgi:outer membrane protein assembly factor BamA